MRKLEKLIDELYHKYGKEPTIEYLGRDVWRAWLKGFHIHTTNASYGSYAANGYTPFEAVNGLLHMRGVVWNSDSCNNSCPKYFYDGY